MAFLKARLAPIVLATVLLSIGARPTDGAAAQAALTEAQAKAGFLYNCLMFVSWPPTAFRGEEFVIGIAGDAAVSAIVRDMQGQKVNDKTLRIVEVKTPDALEPVHVLFVGGDDLAAARALIAKVQDAPVLTVGEHDRFTSSGGAVRLYTEKGRLRFEINITRAESAGLRVSAKMLGLARIVR